MLVGSDLLGVLVGNVLVGNDLLGILVGIGLLSALGGSGNLIALDLKVSFAISLNFLLRAQKRSAASDIGIFSW